MNRKAFTLIELLIVVAIIAILAAIAVPNFLEAQTRSKVSRVKADLRTLGVAVESYKVDNNRYVLPTQRGMQFNLVPRSVELAAIAAGQVVRYGGLGEELSTPIAYISTLLNDPFRDAGWGVNPAGGGVSQFSPADYPEGHPWRRYFYGTEEAGATTWFDGTAGAGNPEAVERPDLIGKKWVVVSVGPDRLEDIFSPWTLAEYDPTNGTVSRGDISRSGP